MRDERAAQDEASEDAAAEASTFLSIMSGKKRHRSAIQRGGSPQEERQGEAARKPASVPP